jgi:hypothetical protein
VEHRNVLKKRLKNQFEGRLRCMLDGSHGEQARVSFLVPWLHIFR